MLIYCLVVFHIYSDVLEDYDDIFGSGGTASGIAIGNYMTSSKLK